MIRPIRAAAMLLALAAAPATASSDAAWAANAKAGRAACIAASNLVSAHAAAAVGFSDAAGVDAMLVSGRWRPKHMHGAKATLLCLYNRAAKTAEVSEAKGWTAPPR